MNENARELRRMSRAELIEIIYQYKMQTDMLTNENARLEELLKERRIKLEKSGSIAEAALSLNSVFETAQKAADQYLESVQSGVADISKRATEIMAEAEESASKLEKEAREKYDEIIAQAEKEAERIRQEASKPLAPPADDTSDSEDNETSCEELQEAPDDNADLDENP